MQEPMKVEECLDKQDKVEEDIFTLNIGKSRNASYLLKYIVKKNK